MSKKTIIKLVGKGWDLIKTHPRISSQIYQNSIIMVEFETEDLNRFKDQYGAYWITSDELFAIEIIHDEPALMPAPMPEPEKPFEFKVGDKVKVPWSDKVFELVDSRGFNGNYYPFSLDVDTQTVYDVFSSDGRQSNKHDKPILTLIERPKKTVKLESFAVVFPSGDYALFKSEDIAKVRLQISDEGSFIEWIGGKEVNLCE